MPRKKEEKVIKKVKIEEEKSINEENKEKTPKKRNIVTYFFGMVAIFVLFQVIIELLVGGVSEIVLHYKYGTDIIYELFYGILVLIVMLLFNNSYVFTSRKEKLGKSLLYAFPVIVFSVYSFTIGVLNLETTTIEKISGLALLCTFIGITEEFLCRGWIQNEFLERFGESKKNVIMSIFLSALIFGLMHITNVFATSQNFFETILQILNATAMGFLFGSLYYKTKNIWSVIILHAFYDFALMIGDINVVKDCTYAIASNKIVFVNVFSTAVLALFWVLSSIVILKKCNFPDSKGYASKTFYFTIIPLLIFTFFVSIIPYDNMIEDYNDYYVCYNYKELESSTPFVLHYPYQRQYTVTSTNKTESFMMDPDSDDLKEVYTVKDYSFNVDYGLAQTIIIKNNNTGKKAIIEDGGATNFVLFENKDNVVMIYTIMNSKLEEEVYISDVMNKNELSNNDEYLGIIKSSFRKLELPKIENIGYITFDGDDNKYPLFTSANHDVFIYKDGEILLAK